MQLTGAVSERRDYWTVGDIECALLRADTQVRDIFCRTPTNLQRQTGFSMETGILKD